MIKKPRKTPARSAASKRTPRTALATVPVARRAALVTGATGFLGAHVVRELCRLGQSRDLRVLVHSSAPRWLDELGVDVVRGSVTNAEDLDRALRGVDRVYHLAGLVSSKPDDAHRMYEIHVDGTRLLCQAAVRAGVRRIVMASTSGTIAVSRRADESIDETCPTPLELVSRWPYYASKVYQEEAARRACADKTELITLNPSLLLGPGDDRLSSTRPVLQFLSREIALIPPGGLSFVDVRDVAAMFPVAMERGAPGERYLLGAYNWTFEEFFGRLERLSKVSGPKLKSRGKLPLLATRAQAALYRHWGRTPPMEPASIDQSEHFWYFDSSKAIRELGFTPRDAADTLFDTVKYIREELMGGDVLRERAS